MNRHVFVAAAVTVALLATGPARAASPTSSCVRVDVKSAAEPIGAQARGFRATVTIDLTFSLLFKDTSSAGHVAGLRVYAPDGNLYRTMVQPIASDGASPGLRQLPGYPRPVAEKPLASVEGTDGVFYSVDFAFPVAGTDIVSTGLYGNWKVEPFLDGQPGPCAATTSFSVRP
jgi:hypothetical protein